MSTKLQGIQQEVDAGEKSDKFSSSTKPKSIANSIQEWLKG